jgi:hypothetical protein
MALLESEMSKHKMPEGTVMSDGRVKIATAFKAENFEAIKAHAEKEGKSFSDAADELVSIGVFDLKELQESSE